ncbi:response regulator transcription factor [Luteolibacter pohnpeiensis]|uniref:Response regulator transcription factor n=1 Tax=Luteolibacter pohnpeiensis TaxID=454153 RepID=A0A934VVT1_9BACT|nr:response regulator transcription factor [Luteolibacter pohnpeiensis]MBK1881824.1 response regulator transcription factor [Luteolibacter pohnpeiensis]
MIKIGIVEDSRTTREGLRTIVDLSPDYQCVGAYETAEEALRLLPKKSPEVVLMDIQLPAMTGVECVQKLKALLPDVLVIMVTVYEDSDRVFSALRAGASGYLLKRSAPEEVVQAIRDVQQGGVPMSGGIARKVIQYFRDQSSTMEMVDKLTPREREILELVANGFTNKELAGRLHLSVDSVRWHLKNIYAKLHVHSRTEAALKFRGPQ